VSRREGRFEQSRPLSKKIPDLAARVAQSLESTAETLSTSPELNGGNLFFGSRRGVRR
jgi:hypothetical protein